MKFMTSPPTLCGDAFIPDEAHDDWESCAECAAALDPQHKATAAVTHNSHPAPRPDKTRNPTSVLRPKKPERMPRPPLSRPQPSTTNRLTCENKQIYYQTLGVPPTATHEEILLAYRRRLEELDCPICNPPADPEETSVDEDRDKNEVEDVPDLIPDDLDPSPPPSSVRAPPATRRHGGDGAPEPATLVGNGAWTTARILEANDLFAASWVLSRAGVRRGCDGEPQADRGEGRRKGDRGWKTGRLDHQARVRGWKGRRARDVGKEEEEEEERKERDRWVRAGTRDVVLSSVTPSGMSGEVVASFVDGMGGLKGLGHPTRSEE